MIVSTVYPYSVLEARVVAKPKESARNRGTPARCTAARLPPRPEQPAKAGSSYHAGRSPWGALSCHGGVSRARPISVLFQRSVFLVGGGDASSKHGAFQEKEAAGHDDFRSLIMTPMSASGPSSMPPKVIDVRATVATLDCATRLACGELTKAALPARAA